MSTYETKCDTCGAVNEVPNYGDWDCCQCGQGYTYDEGHQIRLTDAQWALLRNQPRWIPVDERLPDHLQPVIGWHPGSYRAFGEVCWNATEKQWQDVDTGLACGDVTHWMKMPEPPEVK